MFFGSREGYAFDPFGSTWTISTPKENIFVDEMQRRNEAGLVVTRFDTRLELS